MVTPSPFSLAIRDAAGDTLLESSTDPRPEYAPLAFTHDADESPNALMKGWDYYRGVEDPWHQATRATSIAADGAALVVRLATNDAAHPSATLRIEASGVAAGGGANVGVGVRLVASIDDPGGDAASDATVNRISLGWAMHDDGDAGAVSAGPAGERTRTSMPGDHFLGLGERFHLADHRGQSKTYVWVEDKGLGQGESTPPGPSNPLPNGPTMTYIPVPWVMDPRGFGLLLSTTWRSWFHLGDETPDAWRFEAWTSSVDATVFADADPKGLLEDLTALTGRPPAIADWALAPRRRADLGTGEWDRLRRAHVPTSVIDTAVHYFPNGGGMDHAGLQKVTAELHAKGFKAIAYFCPFVSNGWHPVYDDLAAKGWLVERADGSPYAVLDPPYTAAMIDFTSAGATAWYQAQMQQALDDGWDGWMYDFAEYVPQDAVFSNGMTGMQAHNLYPLLYQKAAHDLLEKQRRGDYLIFVRSGYAGPMPPFACPEGERTQTGTCFAGTGGLVPMVWAGDESTDFDVADGLPAALTAALNAGMSGIPLWGSDISGYHYIYNPPPDKEVYLRWTELGAFSADMHDENEGAGNEPSSARWQIWKDAETLSTYARYAGLKTQMLPYVKVAVREAREHGWPVMRHLYLDHPRDPRTWTLTDEYMLGDSLLVAPVVTRAATSRSVYLPGSSDGAPAPSEWFDYWTGERVAGGRDVTAQAPLDVVPVYAKMGAIIPMLSPEVETVVTPTDGSVISAASAADFLAADVFAGGQSSIELDDGTALSQSAPAGPFAPSPPSHAAGPIPPARRAADLTTCDACFWDDAASRTWSVAVVAQSDTIDAGALVLRVRGPAVKRFVLRVRH